VSALVIGVGGAISLALKYKNAGAFPNPVTILLLVVLFILAIIPVVMAQYRYSMTYFILSEMPGIGPMEAIRQSTRMMDGNKWKYFCLQWRFFGWSLLCILTLGLGFIWLWPYMMTSISCFYDDLKTRQTAS
jgi:uncharacterized membrane protein